ncbi:MAG: S9 family peptidase [Phototrophicaceae bacterium]
MQVKAYGTWSSPVDVATVAGGLRLNDVAWAADGSTLVWSERRGKQGVLVAQTGTDAPRQLTMPPLSVSGRVGYGGGDFTVAGDRVICAGSDGRLYRVSLEDGPARAITPAFGHSAAPSVSPDGRWVVYVHTDGLNDGLALVDVDGEHWPRKLIYGTDFVMQPVWHPAGDRLAFITWDHPNMPWDGTELRLATLAHDATGFPYIETVETIAGNTQISVFQPEFSPDGLLLAYASDKTGWWQLYLYDLTECRHIQVTHVEAEHGLPGWVQGMRAYAWTADSRALIFLRNTRGAVSVHRYELDSDQESAISGLDDYTSLEQIAVSSRGAVAAIASSPRLPPRIVSLESSASRSPARVHHRSMPERIPAAELSPAQPVEWPGHDGETIYGIYYPPTSTRFQSDGAPPLIVMAHGGPTSQVKLSYEPTAQFFATRGFAVLDVNYRGSTGYGRAYRERLRGNWGVLDVEDCASGAQHLVSAGLADASKLVIMGGSAGGYTVLQSLVDKPGFYRAGVGRYAVADLFGLAQDTHKFEARYTDSLVGELPADADIYRARSPLYHAEHITDPVILFQGAEDVVVPPNQSERIVASLRARGVPHEYHLYEGEGHGFRQPQTLEHYYNTVIDFLLRHVVYA